MDLPLTQGRTEEDGSLCIILPRAIDEAIEALRPLQRHQRTVLGMRRDEGGIEAKRFISEDSYSDLYPRLTKALQSTTRTRGKGSGMATTTRGMRSWRMRSAQGGVFP